jgi:hypothetical protein
MANYEMQLIGKCSVDDEYAVVEMHKADPGTYLVFADSVGVWRYPVILWAVHPDCSLSPVSKDGVWGGVSNTNLFILYPDGRASGVYDEEYETEAEAIAAMLKKETEASLKLA